MNQYKRKMKKVFNNADEAIDGIVDNMILMVGGFGLCGIPENCISALVKMGAKNLTCISNNAGISSMRSYGYWQGGARECSNA